MVTYYAIINDKIIVVDDPHPDRGYWIKNCEHESETASLQAKIDSLMLEYCPDKMTEEQLENWAEAQVSIETLCSEIECKEMGCCFPNCLHQEKMIELAKVLKNPDLSTVSIDEGKDEGSTVEETELVLRDYNPFDILVSSFYNKNQGES